ncbi:two-component system sensor histidine kinase CreC [Paucibacter oligotrophus]|uniref:histidine kinase n=1 Tax=Roseateles oligotrophus TaxID=1769250 RepID=A0A840L7F4_9BURK|nr:two-component system sensor histidine kinase CreC [Roseateles oligotrophus]MBB4842585.1 two-component system sensor histidine kinase CreC [Roseateles oligotrophus]
MKLGLRLFLAFFLIAGLSAFFILRVILAEVKPSVREVMEDLMVDSANVLAVLAVDELQAHAQGSGPPLADSRLAQQLREYAQRPVDAQIWGLRKQSLDFRIYLTDAKGQVLLDTGERPAVGQDYSRWRDVALALRGEYGARTSRTVQNDDSSHVMYVAAPVHAPGRGELLGVLTVAKPLATVQRFIDRAEQRILFAGLFLLGLSLLIGVAVTAWLVLTVRRLRDYAQQVQAGGQRQAVPQVSGELGELAQAMDAMRARLEGREHIEQTVRALTHELKSPLAALRGAGELLQEELAAPDRQRFASQVVEQSERLRELVDRMLELSKLELQSAPAHPERVQLEALLQRVLARAEPRLSQRGLRLQWLQREAIALQADPEQLELALSNLLGNALDFAPPGSALELRLWREPGRACFSLRDQGPGVPALVWAQLGQRFFSTPRPDGGGKGSGLGLAIARQVALLHGGGLRFEAAEPGLRVIFTLASHST